MDELGIVAFDRLKSLWTFTERQYNIDPQGSPAVGPTAGTGKSLPANDHTKRFTAMLRTYRNQMPMPTRLIAQEFRFLNDVSFKSFLDNLNLTDSPRFMQGLDYQMVDDYGGHHPNRVGLGGHSLLLL